jgi:hypothetical protein
MAIVEAEVEGTISAVVPTAGGAELTLMGVPIAVTAATAISTPTQALTVAQLLDPTPLPGRAQPGFAGGTGIVEGQFDTDTGILTAATLAVEPAENVMVGAVTENTPGALRVNGTPVVLLTDARMAAKPTANEFGFEIVLSSVATGSTASVEGYHDGSVFRAFLFQTDAPAQLADTAPQTSITRAQTRDRDDEHEIDARGAVTTGHVPANAPAAQTVQIYRVDAGAATFLGTVQAAPAIDTPGFAAWRFARRLPAGVGPVLSQVPTRIRAVNISPSANNAQMEVDAEVRLD